MSERVGGAASPAVSNRMYTVTVDGIPISVPPGSTIHDACVEAGVKVRTLCYHPRLRPVGRCRVCVVKVAKAVIPYQPACSTLVEDNMVINTSNTDHGVRVQSNEAMRRLLSTVSNPVQKEFGRDAEIEELMDDYSRTALEDTSSHAIVRHMSRCVGCTRCFLACKDIQGMEVLTHNPTALFPIDTSGGLPLSETHCIGCGQCAQFCPTNAIESPSHIDKVREAMEAGKMVVLQTAPSTRVAIGEVFGKPSGSISTDKMVAASKLAGFQYVFDTNFAADLTVMEEAHELLERIKRGGPFPLLTSCCPSWVSFVEKLCPDLIPHLSSARSPMMMMGSVIKMYWARENGINPDDVFVVAGMPCTAKKSEMMRREMWLNSGRTPPVDAVLTTEELGRFFRDCGIGTTELDSWENLPSVPFDDPLGTSSGAAVLFGASGGVMEAAVRTAYEVATGQPFPFVQFLDTRGSGEMKEANIDIEIPRENQLPLRFMLKLGVCNGIKSARAMSKRVHDAVRMGCTGLGDGAREPPYHFVEVMACVGGCIGGGGQPHSLRKDVIAKRMQSIYSLDERAVLRKSHENPAIKMIYSKFFGRPMSDLARGLLHTKYFARNVIINGRTMSIDGAVDLSSSASMTNVNASGEHESAVDEVIILYGSQGGTAHGAARNLSDEIRAALPKLHVQVSSMDSFGLSKLRQTATEAKEKVMKMQLERLKLKDAFLEKKKKLLEENRKKSIGKGIKAKAALPKIVEKNDESVDTNESEPVEDDDEEEISHVFEKGCVVIFMVSTFGMGDFPHNAQNFFQELSQSGLPRGALNYVQYAVFGFGSRAFGATNFCKPSRLLDVRLDELGANRILERVTGDDQEIGGYHAQFDPWSNEVLKILGKASMANALIEPTFRICKAVTPAVAPAAVLHPCPKGYSYARMVVNQVISIPGHDFEVRHLEFDVRGAGLAYDVGGHIEVLPRNHPDLVLKFLRFYGLEPNDAVSIMPHHLETREGEEMPFPQTVTLMELFEQYIDLFGPVTRKFLQALKSFAKEKKDVATINRLLDPLHKQEFEEFAQETNYAEALSVFEKCLPPLEHLISILPVITPRTYSIASSPERHPNSVHLIVVAYSWNTPRGVHRWGLCTSYLFRLAASTGESETASASSAGGGRSRPLVAMRLKHIPRAALEAAMGETTNGQAPQEQVQMAGLGVGMVPFSLQKRDDVLRPGPKWVFGRMHGSILPH